MKILKHTKHISNGVNNFIVKALATGLGSGYSPVIPGTIGSLLGIAVFFLLNKLILLNLIITGFLFFLGVITTGYAEKLFGKKDPRQIVIDEIAGCLIFLILVPSTKLCIISGFILYRFLDIIKPFPAFRAQNLPGGWGIMTDDLIAGIYTGAIINTLLLIKKSFYCI